MTEWQDISTAPKDGTPIQADIPGNGKDNIIAMMPIECDETYWAWHFIYEQEPPNCWTDGICWSENEDGDPSVRPVAWKPAPPKAVEA